MIISEKKCIRLIKKCCKLMKIYVPNIVFKIHFASELDQWDNYGCYYEKPTDILFINVALHNSKKHLRYTIIHELLHCKHPDWKHGKKFNAEVDSYYKK